MLIHMMRDPPLSPHKWVPNLLSWYCKSELLGDIERDLHEFFAWKRTPQGASLGADHSYYWCLEFLRPYTVRRYTF